MTLQRAPYGPVVFFSFLAMNAWQVRRMIATVRVLVSVLDVLGPLGKILSV